MKQLTALLLMLLFLFNLAGYRVFFHFMQKQSDSQYARALDNDVYDDTKMITIKVDLDMPYLAENTSLERVDGEINVDGKIYKYVKRKIHNGQLVLLCLPDEKKTKLRSSREEYFFYANSLANHGDSKESGTKATVVKIVSSDYDQSLSTVTFGCFPAVIPHLLPADESLSASVSCDLPMQPPEC